MEDGWEAQFPLLVWHQEVWQSSMPLPEYKKPRTLAITRGQRTDVIIDPKPTNHIVSATNFQFIPHMFHSLYYKI